MPNVIDGRNTREVLNVLEVFSALKNPRLDVTAQDVVNIYNMEAKYENGRVVQFSGKLDNGTTFTLDEDGILKVKYGSHKFLKLAGQYDVFKRLLRAEINYTQACGPDNELYQAKHDEESILHAYAKNLLKNTHKKPKMENANEDLVEFIPFDELEEGLDADVKDVVNAVNIAYQDKPIADNPNTEKTLEELHDFYSKDHGNNQTLAINTMDIANIICNDFKTVESGRGSYTIDDLIEKYHMKPAKESRIDWIKKDGFRSVIEQRGSKVELEFFNNNLELLVIGDDTYCKTSIGNLSNTFQQMIDFFNRYAGEVGDDGNVNDTLERIHLPHESQEDEKDDDFER